MATPMRGLRPVPFASKDEATHKHAVLPPSPYTPYSGRRTAFPSSAKKALIVPKMTDPSRSSPKNAGDSAVLSFPRPESADAFARGGAAEAALRASCLDILTAVGKDAQGLAREITSALEVQISFALEFAEDRSAHPFVRKEVEQVANTLRIERDTWTLVDFAWRSDDVRCRDLCSRRANVNFADDHSHIMPGTNICRRIVEWLEATAGENLDATGGPQLMPLDDPAYQWQYTCSRIGSIPNIDYPILRQNDNALEEVERKAEFRLSREIYRLVRAGRIIDAEMICRHVRQPWRAAVLAGGKNASEISALGVKGGARRAWRAAAQAIAKSSSSAIPPFERAVCGILSGVLEPALAVAESYEDQAWARLSVLVDRAIDRSLSSPRESLRVKEQADKSEDIVMMDNEEDAFIAVDTKTVGQQIKMLDESRSKQKHFADIDPEQILEVFRECTGAGEGVCAVSSALLSQIRAIRAYLSIGPTMNQHLVRGLLSELEKLAQNGLDENLEWICRFASHVAIFLKKTGLLDRSDDVAVASFEMALLSHVRLAINRDLIEEMEVHSARVAPPVRAITYGVAARYLAELENLDVLVAVYTEVMALALRGDLKQERILSGRPGTTQRQIHERRIICLQRAGKCFGRFGREVLDRIVVSSVDRVWAEHITRSPLSLQDDSKQDALAQTSTEYDEISQDDEMVVRCIEYLMFPGFGNYEEALRRATSIARRFFLAGKQTAARYVVEWFPSDAIAEIAPGKCENELHELDCWRAYMDAISRHNEWRTYYFSQRPAPLDESIKQAAVANPGEVSYEEQASANLKMEAYAGHMESYLRVSAAARDSAVEALRVALLFDGGWMRDSTPQESNIEGDAQRNREILAIRKIGVPQLAALLHNVLHESGLFPEAIELAAIVADDGRSLYEDFSRKELGAFLQRANLSAVALADKSVKDGSATRPYVNYMFEETTVDA